MQRLLDHLSPALQDLFLAADLRANATLDESKRVHVLQLGLRTQLVRAGWTEGDIRVAAQRALLHVHVADTQLAQRRAQQLQPLPGLLGAAQVRFGHDLRERCAATVEVHDALLRPVDPSARADVGQLGCVLLQVHAMNPHLLQPPAQAQRLVVLGDLIPLGQVRIEVVLAVKHRARRELRAQCQPDRQAEMDRLGVRHRQRARQAQTDRARVRVRRLPERQLTAAEHLRSGLQLDMDLQADDGLKRHDCSFL